MPVIYSNGSFGNSMITIPELYTDPASPAPQDAWILATPRTTAGSPIGLLLSLTQAITDDYTYKFSYKTLEGAIIRTSLV